MSENNHTPAPFQVSVEVGGRPLILETGKIARQANCAITARYGDTVLLVSACMSNKPNDRDFLPLTVDYRENTYSAGKIPGGFFKREGRPTEKAILVSRLIDRPIRPLFPDSWRNETQIIAMVLSAEGENAPDVIPVTAASAAAFCSELPFNDPIAAVRVGLLDGQLVVNPTVAEQKTSKLNIVVAGTADGIVMVESGAFEISEKKVAEALELGHAHVKKIVAAIKQLHDQIKPKKVVVAPLPFDQAIFDSMKKTHGAKLQDALNTEKHPKKESYHLVDDLQAEILKAVPEEDEEKLALTKRAFERLREDIFRHEVLKAKRRPDGRAFDQVRKITCEAGLLPRVHGSALFTRGETQALATLTLGTKEDMQRLDLLFAQDTFKRFMLHYNFPPFSVGEVKPMRGAGRREIGHGALAERALANLLPQEVEFPYAMRVVSDILESNGSSSMATVCGASLALMDAGVPMKSPCAGIAMGLVVEGGNYSILTDIAGAEDHYGDMDFKVAGRREGITARQMEIKQTAVKIDVLEDGTVHIFSTSGAGGDQALQMVRDVTASAEIGKTYLGKVVRLAEFGPFVELFPGTDGLLHISEISEHRIRDVRDELKLGDQVLVKVLSIEGNKVRLSRKALIREAREKQQKAAGAGATTTTTTEDDGNEANSNISE